MASLTEPSPAVLAFSERTGVTDPLPRDVRRVGRWTLVRWPVDRAFPDLSGLTEAWVGGECYDAVPVGLARKLWQTGRVPAPLYRLLATWELREETP